MSPSPSASSAAARPARSSRAGGAALVVAIGILCSRLAGLVRERVFAHYLGSSDSAGAFKAALRIPNLLQNLFGEGVLSASFIPVYARLLGQGEAAQAAEVAGVVATLLVGLVALLVGLGTLFTEALIDVIAPGFSGEVRLLTIRLVRIMFPGVGLLALSAWCLGILNSHRRFFLSYVAPVLWNIAIIAALVVFGRSRMDSLAGRMDLALWTAWGTVAGAALQLGVQLPLVLRLLGRLRPGLAIRHPGVRAVLVSFGPIVVSRGVVQLSAYIDQLLSSYLGAKTVAAMAYAQTLYLLPVSLFGMSVSAAELPEMARELGGGSEPQAQGRERLRGRLAQNLTRIAYFVVPSAAAFLVLGDVVSATLFQTGAFGPDDARAVWWILGGSTVGLLAVTQGRLLASAFYALSEPRTPLAFAVVRVALTAVLGWLCALPLRAHFGWSPVVAAAALTASAGISGWIEFLLLGWALGHRLGRVGVGAKPMVALWACALGGAAVGLAVARGLPVRQPVVRGALVLGSYGMVYLGLTWALGIEQARSLAASLGRRLRR